MFRPRKSSTRWQPVCGVEAMALGTLELTCSWLPVVHESNVYGVLIPSHDGRAGCVAVAQDANVDLKLLARQVITSLPKYAQPLFVRLVKS